MLERLRSEYWILLRMGVASVHQDAIVFHLLFIPRHALPARFFTCDLRPLQQMRGQLNPAIAAPSCLTRGHIVYLKFTYRCFRLRVARVPQPLYFLFRGSVAAAAAFRKHSLVLTTKEWFCWRLRTTSQVGNTHRFGQQRGKSCLVMGRFKARSHD